MFSASFIHIKVVACSVQTVCKVKCCTVQLRHQNVTLGKTVILKRAFLLLSSPDTSPAVMYGLVHPLKHGSPRTDSENSPAGNDIYLYWTPLPYWHRLGITSTVLSGRLPVSIRTWTGICVFTCKGQMDSGHNSWQQRNWNWSSLCHTGSCDIWFYIATSWWECMQNSWIKMAD